ncbi:MAG: glycine oxidase ThiO [bacterium]
MMKPDCLVAGGGIIGLMTARELREAGLSVTVVERQRVGREASWASSGILSPMYPWRHPHAVTVLARWAENQYPHLAQRLQEESGVDPEWRLSGMLILDAEEEALARDWAIQHRTPLEYLQGDELVKHEPRLNLREFHEALWLPRIAQIRPPRLLRALQSAVRRMGVHVLEDSPVRSLISRHGKITGVETPAGPLEADYVVIATGAWSRTFLAQVHVDVDIRPVRGQIILYQGDPGWLARMVMHQDHYVIPRADGRIVAGSTVEYVGFDKNTTPEAVNLLHGAARRMIPGLENFAIEKHWAGLRPGKADNVPVIGRHPTLEGLYINAGHFRSGVVLAPASARLLADIILGRPPIVDPAPYAV